MSKHVVSSSTITIHVLTVCLAARRKISRSTLQAQPRFRLQYSRSQRARGRPINHTFVHLFYEASRYVLQEITKILTRIDIKDEVVWTGALSRTEVSASGDYFALQVMFDSPTSRADGH